MSSASISITSFFVNTCGKNNLSVRDEGLWIKSLGLFVGVATQLFLSVHMVLSYITPSIMLFLNKRQRLWVPTVLASVLVALSSAIDYSSIDCPIMKNDGEGMTYECRRLLISRTWGIVLAALSGTIVHLEHKLSTRVHRMLAFATWIGFIIGFVCLISSNPFSEIALVCLPTLCFLGYPLGIFLSSHCVANAIFEAKNGPSQSTVVSEKDLEEDHGESGNENNLKGGYILLFP